MTSTHTYTVTHDYKAHQDDRFIDEVRIVTVPRWKTSGLSGDEWRFSYRVELWRKGRVYAQRSFGRMTYAASAAACAVQLSVMELEGWDTPHGDMRDYSQCFNPGCAKPATVEYRLKKEYENCRETSEYRADNRPHRRFCDDHRRRGDCDCEDADANYEPVELTLIEPRFDIDAALVKFADGLETPQGVNERLAYALEAAGITELVERARSGEFSDFDSPHAMPKMVLHEALHQIGSEQALEIDSKMINGEFDG